MTFWEAVKQTWRGFMSLLIPAVVIFWTFVALNAMGSETRLYVAFGAGGIAVSTAFIILCFVLGKKL